MEFSLVKFSFGWVASVQFIAVWFGSIWFSSICSSVRRLVLPLPVSRSVIQSFSCFAPGCPPCRSVFSWRVRCSLYALRSVIALSTSNALTDTNTYTHMRLLAFSISGSSACVLLLIRFPLLTLTLYLFYILYSIYFHFCISMNMHVCSLAYSYGFCPSCADLRLGFALCLVS